MLFLYNSHSMRKQRGVALIQVLLISAIISILAIRFSLTARDQIAMSTAFEQRVKTNQLLKSLQSKVIYTLLTQTNFNDEEGTFPQSEKWNFYGKPFLLEHTDQIKVSMTIQDIDGLLPQKFVQSNLWLKALEGLGFSEENIKQKLGNITDWQDDNTDSWLEGSNELSTLESGQPYRNKPVQLAQEIDFFFAEVPEKLNVIKEISTHYPVFLFNPMQAPTTLLSLIIEPDVVHEIIELRDNNELTSQKMITMLGDDFDSDLMGVSVRHSNKLKITITVELNEVELQETIQVQLQPKKIIPVLTFSRY